MKMGGGFEFLHFNQRHIDIIMVKKPTTHCQFGQTCLGKIIACFQTCFGLDLAPD